MSKKPNINKLFAYRLKRVLEEHEVSADELKEAVDMDCTYMNAMLNGNIPLMCLDDIYNICEYCNCSSDYLFGLSDNIN